MKTKHFKSRHALLMSLTSLMLCVSMLFGATFAWFTDSVTSGVNRIVSGNLDVEVTHKTSGNNNLEESIDTSTKLFTKDINGKDLLWEPEVIAYETFKVSNVGSLALKYAMTLNNVGYNTVKGTTRALTDVIKVAVTPSAPADRAAAQALTYSQTLGEFIDNPVGLPTGLDGYILPGEDAHETFTVVLYWPQGVKNDNDYNLGNINGSLVESSDGQPLYVNLGITLVATQKDNESDSFGTDYDRSAATSDVTDSWAGVTVASASATETVTADAATTMTAAVAPVANQNTTVTFSANALNEGEATLKVETMDVESASAKSFSVVDNSTQSAVATISLTLDTTNGTTFNDNDGTATITTYIAPGLNSVNVVYNGTGDAPTGVTYESSTGKLTFTTTHFSEYVVTSADAAYNETTEKGYADLADALGSAVNGGSVVLLRDVTLTGTWAPIGTEAAPFKGTFDGKGHTISGLTIDDSSMEAAGLFGYVQNGSLKNFNIKGASITAKKKSGIVSGYANGACVFENISVDSTSSITGGSNVSGLVGYLTKGDKSFVEAYTAIKNCSVAATITGTDNRAAGFVGSMYDTRILHFENCTFSGTVSGPARSAQFVGIAQTITGSSGIGSVSAVILDNCSANGTVTEGTENGVLIGWTQYANRHIVLNQFKINSATVTADDYAKLVGYSQCFAAYKNSITNVIQVDGKIVGFYQGSGDNSKNGNYQSVDAGTVYVYNANAYEDNDSIELNCDYTLCLNDDYTLTYKVNKMTLIHGENTGLGEYTKFVGNNDNAELYITCKESGDNYSSSVEDGNFYNTNGEPITVFKTGYSEATNAYDNTVGFKWDSTLNGWRLLGDYSDLYPATT